MEQIIKYAYLRKCSINADNVHELLISADYVGIIGLVTLCKQQLAQMLTPENCVSIMGFARYVHHTHMGGNSHSNREMMMHP